MTDVLWPLADHVGTVTLNRPEARNALGAWVSRSLGELFATADNREGVRSFLEQRPAVFQGR